MSQTFFIVSVYSDVSQTAVEWPCHAVMGCKIYILRSWLFLQLL